MEKKLNVIDAGHLSYGEALELQLETQRKRIENQIDDTIIFVEHPPVITTGRRDQSHNIFVDPGNVGAELVKTSRGGEVTYHGPGQIVGYVIINIETYGKGIKSFVNNLEDVFIQFLDKYYSIVSNRDKQHRGVWIENAKISAIGLAINKKVTMHGFAFNVNTDLSHFDWIVPCGINGRTVTSLEKLTGGKLDMEIVQKQILSSFKKVFGYL